MKDLAETYHLQLRGNRWYYHRRVPPLLVASFGKTVLKFSLGTTNKVEAKRLRAIHDVEYDAQFAQLEQGGKTAPTNVEKTKPASAPMRRVALDVLTEYLRSAVDADEAKSAAPFVAERWTTQNGR